MSEAELLSEEDRIFAWKTHYFLDLDFDADAAVELAMVDADPHEAEALLKAGCPHVLCGRLVRP